MGYCCGITQQHTDGHIFTHARYVEKAAGGVCNKKPSLRHTFKALCRIHIQHCSYSDHMLVEAFQASLKCYSSTISVISTLQLRSKLHNRSPACNIKSTHYVGIGHRDKTCFDSRVSSLLGNSFIKTLRLAKNNLHLWLLHRSLPAIVVERIKTSGDFWIVQTTKVQFSQSARRNYCIDSLSD